MRAFLDVECYRNYFLVMLRNEEGRCKAFEKYEGCELDRHGLVKILSNEAMELVTFNGASYDLPIIAYALRGASLSELKAASDDLIVNKVKHWDFYYRHDLQNPAANHIDLIEVAPGMVGLKLYGGRLHVAELEDLPYPPDAVLTREQQMHVKAYCRKDLVNTEELYGSLSEQIELRRTMSAQYGIDLRSKSDAQIAEAVLKAEFRRMVGFNPVKVQLSYDKFNYSVPDYIQFESADLTEKLETICAAEMVINETGHVDMPKDIEKMVITIGNTDYKLGIGGIHSQESEVAHYATPDYALEDIDVESYYPNLMLNMNMSPEAFGQHFQPVYRNILEERLAAKHSGEMVKSNSLKIVLNGTFGKTSSKYSLLYNPKFMIQTTLTGQLCLLMLIETLESNGIPVVSANTDGIVVKYTRQKAKLLAELIAAWESKVNLRMEKTAYRALYSRDVNNYIAITESGKVKAKGVYGKGGLSKNPQNAICAEAVTALLTERTPLAKTIRGCADIRKFLTLRTVNGGAEKEGFVLGKAIRWYYSTEETGHIVYKTNGNKVPRSRGAKPLMNMPDTLPTDIDYGWYIRECEEMLMCLGVIPRPVLEKLPRKNTKAWKALFEAGSIEESDDGKWTWVNPEAHTIS